MAAAADSLESVESELAAVDLEIRRLQARRDELLMIRQALTPHGAGDSRPISLPFPETPSAFSNVTNVTVSPPLLRATTTHSTVHAGGDSTRIERSLINTTHFRHEQFPWSVEMREAARQLWSIQDYRPLQLDIMNATMSKEDVVVILATGSGKSICFQLPALLCDGLTLVVSPLISLIIDQVMELQERAIPADRLSGGTSTQHKNEIMDKLKRMAKRGNNASAEGELSLLYVTPEKVVNSKQLLSVLEKLYVAGRLARIVIDEAHCCSQYGHDFRPDYKKLGVLKAQFPSTPIIALTATCPAFLLDSIMSILHLDRRRTLVFSGSLNRPNLFYSVVNKPASASASITWIVDFIRNKYPGQSGIVYCLSKKDTDTVAEAIQRESHGTIRCAVYNSDTEFAMKERIQTDWRNGRVHVVVATIAFGMGINHPRVRFVVHHSMSKSLEGYYQESGRAGRDGAPAECVLMYRGQDASRLSPLVYNDSDGIRNVSEMLRYCNTLGVCRRELIREYFGRVNLQQQQQRGMSSATANSAFAVNAALLNRWTTEEGSSNEMTRICDQQCDVCKGPTGANVDTESKRIPQPIDLTPHAYTVCRLLELLRDEHNEKLTLAKLVDAWRGRVSAVKNKAAMTWLKQVLVDESMVSPSMVVFPLDKSFTEEEAERILVHLLLEEVIAEEFHFTSYAAIVYLKSSQKGKRLVKAVEDGKPLPTWWKPQSICMMENPMTKKATKTSRKKQKQLEVGPRGEVEVKESVDIGTQAPRAKQQTFKPDEYGREDTSDGEFEALPVRSKRKRVKQGSVKLAAPSLGTDPTIPPPSPMKEFSVDDLELDSDLAGLLADEEENLVLPTVPFLPDAKGTESAVQQNQLSKRKQKMVINLSDDEHGDLEERSKPVRLSVGGEKPESLNNSFLHDFNMEYENMLAFDDLETIVKHEPDKDEEKGSGAGWSFT